MPLSVRVRSALSLAALCLMTLFTIAPRAQAPAAAPPPAPAAPSGVELVRATYTKFEYMVPMRDGARLFTAVYVPKDASRPYPFLITRTPYNIAPYGVDRYKDALGPSEHFQKEGFIFVYQDARGRYMSEGEFQQVRPFNPSKGPKDVDESTDTYDTIDWLLKNIPNNNGRAGMVGVSQPGFHVAASIINSHPALKAASPQAPTADYYMGDDVYHNGAFMLGANFGFYSSFVARGTTPEPPKPALRFDPATPDMYDFFLHTPVPLARMNAELFGGKAAYWQEIVDHTAYDDFWKKRSLWKFMDGVKCAVLNVGGWFDAEDPMGPLRIYRAVEEKNSGHGQHARDGAVVARRLGARRRADARQPRLRVQDRRVLPRADPVPVLHGVSEGQAGKAAGSVDVPDRHQRVPPPGLVAAEESAADHVVLRRGRQALSLAAGRRRGVRRVRQRSQSARCRTSATSAAG